MKNIIQLQQIISIRNHYGKKGFSIITSTLFSKTLSLNKSKSPNIQRDKILIFDQKICVSNEKYIITFSSSKDFQKTVNPLATSVPNIQKPVK